MKKEIVLAALAGLSTAVPTVVTAAAGKVHCWGINKCADHTGCGVGKTDIKAANDAFGKKFQGSTAHDCGGNGKCAGAKGQLGWIYKANDADCFKAKGFVIKKVGGKKVVVTGVKLLKEAPKPPKSMPKGKAMEKVKKPS